MSGESNRELTSLSSGVVARSPADDKLYPVPGQGVEKRKTAEDVLLPIIEVQHLTTAPTLKAWLESRVGTASCPEHETIIQALRNARSNGAPINLNVNEQGYYDLAFSGANGNMVRIEDFQRLLDAGLSLGDCLRVTKLVCGPNGSCGNPGPCAMCRDISAGCYVDACNRKENRGGKNLVQVYDSLDEEINSLLSQDDRYYLHQDRIMNAETSKSAAIREVREMCQSTGKSVVYILEALGVYRDTEAASHTALKRGDLGGK